MEKENLKPCPIPKCGGKAKRESEDALIPGVFCTNRQCPGNDQPASLEFWEAIPRFAAAVAAERAAVVTRIKERFPPGSGSGKHLGRVRSWIQTTFRNGETVHWGSNDELEGSGLSVQQLEQLAHEIKDAVIAEVVSALRSKTG